MFRDERLNGKRRPSSDLVDQIVGSREDAVRVVDGNFSKMRNEELAAGPARDPIALGIERRGVVTRRTARLGASDHLAPFLDRH